VARLGQPLADLVHVLLQLRIVVDVVLLADVCILAPAHRNLLRLGEQHEVRIAGDGVLRAAGKRKRHQQRRDAGTEIGPHARIVLYPIQHIRRTRLRRIGARSIPSAARAA